jgi:hypothetical protein
MKTHTPVVANRKARSCIQNHNGSVQNLTQPAGDVLSLKRLQEIKWFLVFLNAQVARAITKQELKEIWKFKDTLGVDVSVLELVRLMIARKGE